MAITVHNLRIGHYGYKNNKRFFLDGADSAGGISITGKILNNSRKAIKNIVLSFEPYDKNGETLSCSMRNKTERNITVDEAIAPGEQVEFFCENLWYNYSISSCKAVFAKILFADGSEKELSASQIKME